MQNQAAALCLTMLLGIIFLPLDAKATGTPSWQHSNVDAASQHLWSAEHRLPVQHNVEAFTSHGPNHTSSAHAPFIFIADPRNPSPVIRDWVLGIVFRDEDDPSQPFVLIEGIQVGWGSVPASTHRPVIKSGFSAKQDGTYHLNLANRSPLPNGDYRAVFYHMVLNDPSNPTKGVSPNKDLRFVWKFSVAEDGESLADFLEPLLTPIPKIFGSGFHRRL